MKPAIYGQFVKFVNDKTREMSSGQRPRDALARGPMGRIAVFLSSGLGVGYIPAAPGTFGTLWGVLLFYLARQLPLAWFFAGTFLFFLFAVGVAHRAEKSLGGHDHSLIVIDEVAGYLATVCGLSFSWPLALAAFILFRFFDIVKPFPVRWADRRIPGGLGVVLDDILAGVYANILLRVGLYFWQP